MFKSYRKKDVHAVEIGEGREVQVQAGKTHCSYLTKLFGKGVLI